MLATGLGGAVLAVGAFLAGVGSALSGLAAYRAVSRRRKNGNGA